MLPVLKSSFLRNVSILTGGTLFSQVLTVLALPLLTRLYTPADFDLLAVYMAVIGIVTVVASLRYNIAIPLPEDDANGMGLLTLSLICAAFVSLLMAIPFLLMPEAIAGWIRQPAMAPYLWMVPAGIFFAAIYNALQYWASRQKRFGLVTRTRIMRSMGGVGTQVMIGTISPSPFGLIFGHMLYGGLGIIALLRDIWRQDRAPLMALRWAKIRQLCISYRRFPIWSVPEALFNTAGVQLPIVLIAAIAAGPEAGFLMLAMRVLGLPMGLVGASVAQVFLAEAPAKLSDGTLRVFTRQTMMTLLRIGAPPLALVGVLSPFLFSTIFGADWARAGWLVAWMTPWFILQFVASPVSMVLHVTGQVATAMWLQAFGLFLRVGSVIGAMYLWPDRVAEVFAVTTAFFYLLYLWVILRCLK